MRKTLRRRSAALATLAVVAVAAALLFANVAGALPGAGGGQGAAPAAPAATVGAPHGAAAPPTTLTAMPDACPRGLSAAQADRQAQQLASQRGSRSTSQVAPNSNCCPVCDPPTTHATVPNPPTTSPPPPNCHLWLGVPLPFSLGIGGLKGIYVTGGVSCDRQADLQVLVTLNSLVHKPYPGDEVGRTQTPLVWASTASAEARTLSCETGKYFGTVQATANGVYLGKMENNPPATVTC